ncbi:MAG: hypothetical protein K8F91_22030 [Candidatus Obscuribacterales bacterium]|nr:hypothetical protein [Candidatus Obscuribacterales bacterium]
MLFTTIGRSLTVCLILSFILACPGALAQNNNINSAARRLNSDTGQLVKSLQVFLQNQGRWKPPAGSNDMKACISMENLQQQTNQLLSRSQRINAQDLEATSNNLQQALQGLESTLTQIGVDQVVQSKLRTVTNDLFQLRSAASLDFGGSGSFNSNPGSVFNNSGSSFGRSNLVPTLGNTSGFQFISSRFVGPDLMSVTWQGPRGNETFVSRKGSFIISDGINSRQAVGQEVQMLNQAYSGSTGRIQPGGFQPGFGQGGGLNLNASGKGQFFFQNVLAMDIKQVTVQEQGNSGWRGRRRGRNNNGPINQVDIVLTSKSGQNVGFTGQLLNPGNSNMQIALSKSGAEAASGNMNINVGNNGNISMLQAIGSIGEKPFRASFKN